jgi:LysM repeat protein
MDAIMAANGLVDAHRIFAGQTLTIPGGADSSPDADPVATSIDGAYAVQWGDTLTGIALRHGVTIWSLIEANGLSSPYAIYAGQQLTIPGAGPEPAPEAHDVNAPPDAPLDAPLDPPPGEGNTYLVRRGDTLFRIARRHGTTTAALAHLNGIANPSAVYAGQVLRLTGTPPAPTGAGKRILIDLSEQHLYAFEGDQLIYSFVASSGAAPTYTRTGEFRVQSKIPNAYGATWSIWMPHWLGIYWAGGSENGIHGLPLLPNGQTLWAGYLGTPISYGCVVLGTYEAQSLYLWAEIGTPVVIQP